MNNEIEELEQKLADMLEQNLTLYSMLYETLEKQGCENVASTIEQMTNLKLEEQSNWYKGNKTSEELNTRLVEEMELSAKRRQIIEDLTLENRVLVDALKKKDELLAKKNEQLERYKTWYIELAEDSKNKYNEMYEFCIEQLNQVEADILDYTDVYWRTFSKTQDIYILYDDLEDCLKEYIGKRIEKLREAIQK